MKIPGDATGAEQYVDQFATFIKENSLTGAQIYNVDETRFFYFMLQATAMTHTEKSSAPGYKKK